MRRYQVCVERDVRSVFFASALHNLHLRPVRRSMNVELHSPTMKNSLVKIAVLGIAAVSFTFTSCTPTQQGAAMGAGIGAGAGALIGSQSGNAGRGALIGGAVGGLSGALIGDASEKQYERGYDHGRHDERYRY